LQQAIHGTREITPRAMRHLKLIELPIIGDAKRKCQHTTIAPINCMQQQRNQRQQRQSGKLALKNQHYSDD
jgi:hypothetical protein